MSEVDDLRPKSIGDCCPYHVEHYEECIVCVKIERDGYKRERNAALARAEERDRIADGWAAKWEKTADALDAAEKRAEEMKAAAKRRETLDQQHEDVVRENVRLRTENEGLRQELEEVRKDVACQVDPGAVVVHPNEYARLRKERRRVDCLVRAGHVFLGDVGRSIRYVRMHDETDTAVAILVEGMKQFRPALLDVQFAEERKPVVSFGQWEYKVDLRARCSPAEHEAHLQSMGAEGWELCSAPAEHWRTVDDEWAGCCLTWKRAMPKGE